MEYIKIAKVNNVILHRKGQPLKGTLHLTTHHLIFTSDLIPNEFWFPYPMISTAFKNNGSALLSKYTNEIPSSPSLDTTKKSCSNNSKKKSKNIPLIETLKWYSNVDIWSLSNIKIVGKDYTVFSLDFIREDDTNNVFDTLVKLTVLPDVTRLYAFIYQPNDLEIKFNSWEIYNPESEFTRQGIRFDFDSCPWRISSINQDYKFCPTYPNKLVVPKMVSDILLTHASKYRSKKRIPTLCYFYKKTNSSIIRCSQPLPGITKQRSLQDETLVKTLFQCSKGDSVQHKYNSTLKNCDIIVDARPMANAIAQTALGGGTESKDNYNCERIFLGIDNIHVMSDAMSTFTESFLMDTDVNNNLSPSMIHKRAHHWIKSIKLILSNVDKLTKAILFNHANMLIHCSDGWDRTPQVCSLIQLCLDPYYRTFEGFMVLIEKDWISFGHKFMERSGHLSSTDVFHDNTVDFKTSITNHTTALLFGREKERKISGDSSSILLTSDIYEDQTNISRECDINISKNFKTVLLPDEKKSGILDKVSNQWITSFQKKPQKRTLKFTSPIFQQFLDCVYQLLNQNPTSFEFNEKFLRRLVYHLYSCQYGSFLFNCQQEMKKYDATKRTRSVWDYFKSKKTEFINTSYIHIATTLDGRTNQGSDDTEDWIQPDLSNIKWWWELYGRKDKEMNIVPDDTFKKWESNKQLVRNPVQYEKDSINFNFLNQTKDLLSSLNKLGKK